jgi:hypothetical protein
MTFAKNLTLLKFGAILHVVEKLGPTGQLEPSIQLKFSAILYYMPSKSSCHQKFVLYCMQSKN